jgi:hypothetical protein
MTHGGGGGSKIGQKSKKCHVLFEWPLTNFGYE